MQTKFNRIFKQILAGKSFTTFTIWYGPVRSRCLEAEKCATAWFVSVDQPKPQPALEYKSNAEETDTRIWLHVHQSTQQRLYVMSPDTDVYHIGLPLHFGNKEILIEINVTGSNQKRILNLSIQPGQ